MLLDVASAYSPRAVVARGGSDEVHPDLPAVKESDAAAVEDGAKFVGPESMSARNLITDATSGSSSRRRWERTHRRRVLAVDCAAIFTSVVIAEMARPFLALEGPAPSPGRFTVISVALAIAWLVALGVRQSRDIMLVGIGAEEYRRVVSATAWVFGLTAVSSLILQTQVSRAYLLIALPLGLLSLVVGRHVLRRNVSKRRVAGDCLTRVVVLGKPESITVLCETFERSLDSGYSVVGSCIPEFDGEVGCSLITKVGLVPVLGDEHSVENALRLTKADAIVIAAVDQLGHEKMRKLAWRLDVLGVDMIVVPDMTDIAGPRLRLRPIDGLPLFHIARPRRDWSSAFGKRTLDLWLGSAVLIAALAMFVAAALAIKLEDNGPVFFRQERVGQGGKLFRIIKFRTMTIEAESRKDAESAATGAVNGIFFKSAADSRITRVGRLLRATSIDELPQLLNVLAGSMSLVGPRPLVPGEGASVADFIERRALVKPGMTGLWQVSGRSDVSDEERIRLDHSYIDNWSWVSDVMIVWRTVRVVLSRRGAY